MSELWPGIRRWRWTAAGFAAVACFAVLAGRFWHPYYGFTKFIQLDEADARSGIHEVREHPVFAYDGFNGYDGAAYAQIAFHPLLDSPELQPALGNVPYRARRILGSALAWLIALGNPARIANAYAALNLAVWFALAILLWRALPVTDGRSWLAWAGVLFSAGALHSVRLALTDLLAATLVLGAMMLRERGRAGGAIGTLAAAGLARETALAAVAGLWRGPWLSVREGAKNVVLTVLVTVPLLAWMAYVHWKAGPAAQGFGNFTWPVVAWLEKGGATIADFYREPGFRWLNATTLFALSALTVQAIYFLRHRTWTDAWWRMGLTGVAMMALLGTSVWEGHPGAATRVLLPMTVAFAIVAVRQRAAWPWIALGSLSVFSGVLALWHVPADPREIAAGKFAHGAYVVRLGDGWYGVERRKHNAWAWTSQDGQLVIDRAPGGTDVLHLRVKVRGVTPRPFEIRDGDRVLWNGNISERAEWIRFALEPRGSSTERAQVNITLASAMAGVPENNLPNTRALGFAVYGVEIE